MENRELKNMKHFFDPTKLAVVYRPGDTLEEKLPEIASSFEMVTKIPAHMRLRHQELYDEYIARKRCASTRTFALDALVWKTTSSSYIRI